MGIFDAQQLGARKMNIIGFDNAGDDVERQSAIGCGINGLWLDTAENRSATGLKQIVMRLLSNDILFTTLAMCQQRYQICLCTRW